MENDDADRRPVARRSAPTLWVERARPLVEFLPVSEDLMLAAEVSLVGNRPADTVLTWTTSGG